MTNLELNQFIHTKLFDSCWHESPTNQKAVVRYKCFKCDKQWWDNPDYCGNIEDAFKVVEKLRTKWLAENPQETQYFRISDCCQYGWQVQINLGHHDGDILIAHANGQSLPLAICLAAKAALEEK